MSQRTEERQLVLELLKRYEGYNFIILLNVHLKFRGMGYTLLQINLRAEI